ncbi:McrB family protein [Heyndrickxia coagulans]|uniref:AAA family ATPase n=1 Tax=Heyndrickxia coagulans TaxID=1398 RepID=A0AAW7CL61_HEYCO|nr:AAA family ATPase [Heyndrickxia coagulans]MDL5041589.1 AAA family ATPase [Heyndrickxia coagulans]
MNIFVSEDSIKKSVEYFSKLSIKTPEQFGLFFLCKGVGINQRTYKPLKKAGQITDDEKKVYYDRLHKLGAVFDFNEEGIKKCCLFPFSIKEEIVKGNFYNQASSFQGLLSRLIDTIDNTLIDKFLEKQDDSIRLKRNYIQLIKELYLNGNKISLTFFSAYYCRFITFPTDEIMDSGDFTRLCVKYTIDSLNILERELDEFFYDDTTKNQLTFQDKMITGRELRNMFTFKGVEDRPEISSSRDCGVVNPYMLVLEDVRRYVELNGNNPSANEIKELLELKKQIVLYGVPGIGKSMFIKELEEWKDEEQNSFFDETIKIQFHPSTTYEEFIGGSTIEDGKIVSKAGIFLKWCEKAKTNDTKKYLFVIDEINRGNISKIFGETILALDRGYIVNLVKPLKIEDKEIREFEIPNNLYIIATMNSADRSIAILDNAIRRRFAFIKLFPNYDIVKELSEEQALDIDISRLYRSINKKILDTLNDEELQLGQSYFLPDYADREESTGKIIWSKKLVRLVFNYNILPIIEEYTYGNKNDLFNILGEKIPDRIYEDDEFMEALKEQFPEIIL